MKRDKFKFVLGVPQCVKKSGIETASRATAFWVADAVGQWFPKSLSECPFQHLFDALASVSPGPLSLKVIRVLEEHYKRADGWGGWRMGVSPLDRLTRDGQLDEIRSSWVRANQISRTLYDLAEYTGYKGSPDWERVLLRYFILDLLCFSIETLKFHTLWLGNIVKKDDSQKRKSAVEGTAGLLIDGAFRRFCLQKLRKPGRRAWILSDTLQMGLKRGFPSMKDIEVEDSLRDYALALSREKEADDEALDEIRRTSLEVFGDLYPAYDQYPISLSATLNYTRGDWGLRGYAVNRFYSDSGNPAKNHYSMAVIRSGAVSYLGGYECNTWRAREFRVEPEVDYMECYVRALNSRRKLKQEFLESRVAVVREPLKVRPITAGQEDHYLILKPFQVSMWRALQSLPQFSLTSHEFTESALEQITKIPKKFGHLAYQLRQFISSDYSQSTNDLAANATKAAWQTAWGSEYWDIIGPGLDPHLIHLRDTAFFQKNGQLMGSPLSFPILCVINAAVARWSFERWLKSEGRDVRLSIRECPMLVNGDDYASASCPAHYAFFKDCIRRVGWTLSPGKSYFSDEFVQINSRTCPVEWAEWANGDRVAYDYDYKVFWDKNDNFQIDYREVNFRLQAVFGTQIPFVNFGFLEMMSKDTAQLDEPVVGQVTVGWEGRMRWVKRDPYSERQIVILRRNFYNQFQAFLEKGKLGEGDVDPELSTSYGGLSLNPHCTCAEGPCAACRDRIDRRRPKFAIRGIKTPNFAGLDGEERPKDGLRLARWSETVQWKRPLKGASEKCRSCGDVFELYIPAFESQNRQILCASDCVEILREDERSSMHGVFCVQTSSQLLFGDGGSDLRVA